MSYGWGSCPECDTWLDWDDIDMDERTCPECDTPLNLDRGDEWDYEPDPVGRGWDDRCVGAVDAMGNSVR